MTRIEFKDMIKNMYVYFRLKNVAGSDEIDNWYADFKYVDNDCIPFVLSRIKDLDNLPRNLPKAIKRYYAEYRHINRNTVYIHYDRDDDPRFPIKKLYQATEILLTKGETPFSDYCRQQYMPQQDVERCRNKANHVIDKVLVDELIGKVATDISDILIFDRERESPSYEPRRPI